MTIDDTDIGGAPLLRIRSLASPHAGPFSLDVEAGECVAILGPSGSGKSAFLRMLADLDPNSGAVFLGDRTRESWPAPEWRSQVLYQAAEPAWWEPSAGAHFSPGDRQTAALWLAGLALAPAVLDADITRLSTGERQRLALLRSLARRPQVLLLDEPTSALDQASTAAVEALLKARMEEGLAIVLVTHSSDQAKRIGNRALEIRDGGMRRA